MIFLVLLIIESPLNHDDDFDDNLKVILSYFVLICVAAYFFLTCGENPGWVQLPESEDTSLEKRNISTKYHPPLELQKHNDDILKSLEGGKHSFKTNSLDSNEDLKDVEMKNLEEEVHIEFSNKNNLGGRLSGSESNDSFLNDEYSVFSLPPKHFCRACNIEQEYRTRHCHKCQKCVYKYDHHCFWIGFSEFYFFFN